MNPAAVARLRDDLTAAGYSVDALRRRWGDAADAALHRGDRVPVLRALAGDGSAVAVLARTFLLGADVADDELAAALPTLGVEAALELGLVERRGHGRVAPALDLRPYELVDSHGVAAWWIASDLGELATGGALRTDHVLGVGGASATLSALQLPDVAGRVLDLGTGCGIQSLHASRFATTIVATDISERALRIAALNAALAGVELDLRAGSLFDPVAGERFDRIVSNPPFVITPRADGVPAYEYRDGGEVGDGLLQRLIAGLPEHLAPGGIAQLLGNWEYRETADRHGADGLDRAAAWAREAGLEWWIIEREVLDPARYAETWIRDGGTREGTPEFERLVAAWLDDFATRGVTAVGFGYLLLRSPDTAAAPDRPPLQRTERLPEALGDNPAGLGDHLSRVLAGRDATVHLDDRAFLALAPRVAPDVTEERSHWPGEEHPSVIALRQGGGFGRSVRVGTALAAVVGACDGALSLRAIVDAVAGLLEVDAEASARELLPELHELVAAGVLDVS